MREGVSEVGREERREGGREGGREGERSKTYFTSGMFATRALNIAPLTNLRGSRA